MKNFDNGWKGRLLEKVKLLVTKYPEYLYSWELKHSKKVKTILESGGTPLWEDHKTFIRIHTRVIGELGQEREKEMQKGRFSPNRSSPNYAIDSTWRDFGETKQ